jgi:hypothetical protein
MNHDCITWTAEKWLSSQGLPPGLNGLPHDKPLYQKLRGLWHPDRNQDPRASEVFFHVLRLFEKTVTVTEDIITLDGRHFRIAMPSWTSTEWGRVSWGDRHVVWRAPQSQARRMIEGERHARGVYADDAMRQQFAPLLPGGQLLHTSTEAFWVQPRVVGEQSLQSLHDQMGAWPLVHAAWVVSGLLNLACYCHYRQISHLGWTMAHLAIDTKRHQVRLCGGWWYATPWSHRAWGVPREVLAAQDASWRSQPTAGPGLDVRAIQALSRALMGPHLNSGAASLWLRQPWTGTAFDAYGSWRRALERDQGPPRFTPFPTSGTF